jgi:hypothetical protein
MAEERFHYFRAHAHPLGWGVRDSKQDCVVAFGDKSICAETARRLNGKPPSTLLDDYGRGWDEYVAGGAPKYRYDHDSGKLEAFGEAYLAARRAPSGG